MITTKTHHKHESHCLGEKLDVIGKNHKCQSHEKSQTSYVFKSGITIKMYKNQRHVNTSWGIEDKRR